MIGILLNFIAVILFLPLQFINFFVVLWVFRDKNSFFKNIDNFFFENAIIAKTNGQIVAILSAKLPDGITVKESILNQIT